MSVRPLQLNHAGLIGQSAAMVGNGNGLQLRHVTEENASACTHIDRCQLVRFTAKGSLHTL